MYDDFPATEVGGLETKRNETKRTDFCLKPRQAAARRAHGTPGGPAAAGGVADRAGGGAVPRGPPFLAGPARVLAGPPADPLDARHGQLRRRAHAPQGGVLLLVWFLLLRGVACLPACLCLPLCVVYGLSFVVVHGVDLALCGYYIRTTVMYSYIFHPVTHRKTVTAIGMAMLVNSFGVCVCACALAYLFVERRPRSFPPPAGRLSEDSVPSVGDTRHQPYTPRTPPDRFQKLDSSSLLFCTSSRAHLSNPSISRVHACPAGWFPPTFLPFCLPLATARGNTFVLLLCVPHCFLLPWEKNKYM